MQSYSPPEWAAALGAIPRSRVRLAQIPTPIQRWEPSAAPEGVELWIKRDDMTGSTLSGNKARKLEFLLADALDHQCDTVITCGGIQSNHARATAVAARELGLSAHLVLNCDDPTADPGLIGNLLLDRLVGAELHLITARQYFERDGMILELEADLRRRGQVPYVIPEGGSNALGSWGYLEAAEEILQQIDNKGLEITDIVHACGSGGTAAGLSLGLHLADSPIRVHPVNVCWDPPHFYKRMSDIFADMGTGTVAAVLEPSELVDMLDGYVGLGYAKSRPQEISLLIDTAKETGVILDPVYTGKAFFGLVNELAASRGRFRGNSVLFVHTGGLFGLYDKLDEIGDIPLSCSSHL